ncbi:MAG: asparagine synthase (glutamine-hydrolyzing) [Candidatus Riflebacteria bacterium]|nr:asparagine synthase (glutamine-hydrolyzing) [Candidatus Riflebacteria bacterium]
MCGIAGIFNYKAGASKPVDRAELLRIREAMFSRGPDQGGLWLSQDGCLGLANRRLAIQDLSDAGSQPMVSANGRLRVVFNGEIYNYPEIRARLLTRGVSLHSTCDTEILLHLWEEKGARMLDDLRGMYAFAIYDEINRGLFLARDPFGIKPLYYSDDGATIRFASQVKALIAGGAIDQSLEPAGRVGFFILGYVPAPFTLYKAVMNLPAGSRLWIPFGGRTGPIEEFCSIPKVLAEAEAAPWRGSLRAQEETLHDALSESVRLHLISDVRLGIFLSSGLDSSAITGLSCEHSPGNVATFTLGFEEFRGTENDETAMSGKTAALFRTDHSSRFVGPSSFEECYNHLLASMDQPTIDGANTYFVSKMAKAANMTVALSGLGGDEMFGTYPSFSTVPRLVSLFSSAKKLASLGRFARELIAPFIGHLTSPKYAGLFEYGGSWGGAYLLRRGLFMPWELCDLLDPETVREGWERLDLVARLDATVAPVIKPRLKVSALEMCWYMRGMLLRDADWAGMAHSQEIRVPFVDITLLRKVAPMLAAPCPPRKRMLGRLLNPPLPAQLLYRRKTGFSVPIRDWLLKKYGAGMGERGLRSWARLIDQIFTGAPDKVDLP